MATIFVFYLFIYLFFQEYPDYYTLIKKPIDMSKINTKLYGDQYQTLDDFMSDFQLMFDNACRYNEPDSQVYKVQLSVHKILGLSYFPKSN